MNKTFKLTLTLLKTSFDLGLGKRGAKSKPGRSLVFAAILFVLFIGSVSLPIIFLASEVVNTLNIINLPEIVWYIILPLGSLILTVLSIFTVISIMFLSNDNKTLLFLPLTPQQIMTARFSVSLIYTYLIELVFIVPIFIGYGLALNLNYDFYIISSLISLMIPIIPLSIIVLLLSFALRYTNLTKYRDAFTYIAMGVVLAISLGFNFVFSQALSAIEIDPAALALNIRSLIGVYEQVINRFLPHLIFALNALTSNEVIHRLSNLAIFLILNLGVFILVIIFAGPIYLRTIVGSDEKARSKKNNLKLVNGYNKNHFISLIVLEWKTMARSPIYFLNLIFVIFLVPILIIGSLFFGVSSGSQTQLEISELILILESLNYSFNNPLFVGIILGVSLFLGSTTLIAPTAISRLGGSAPFFKSLPISYFEFINFKTFWANFLTIIPLSVYILGLSLYGLMSIFNGLLVIITITPLFILINYLGLLIDLFNPKLDWLNEAQAVKQNLNGIFYMLGIWALTALVVYGSYLISESNLNINGYGFLGIVFGLSVIGNIGVLVYFNKNGYKLFKGVA